MSETTANLALPLIAAGQAGKHVTHNEALAALDTIVQLACLDKDLTDPPAAPAEGDRYLLAAAAPTGAWTGLSGHVVHFRDGVWADVAPRAGWLAYVADEGGFYLFDGTAWAGLRPPSPPCRISASSAWAPVRMRRTGSPPCSTRRSGPRWAPATAAAATCAPS